MKKQLIGLCALIPCTMLGLTSCFLDPLFNNKVETIHVGGDKKEFARGRSDCKVIFDDDLELFASENFGNDYRDFHNLTIEGNNHTLTISGNKGTVRPGQTGIYNKLKDCVIKDLNIVVDFTWDLTNSDFSNTGLIANSISNCVLYDVDITFNYDTVFRNGGSGAFGALVGDASHSYISGCDIKGNFDVQDCAVGGIVGALYYSKIDYSTFTGNLVAHGVNDYFDDYYRTYAGGIAGLCNSTSVINACTVNLNQLNTNFNNDNWRSAKMSVGGIAGYVNGKVTNNLVKFGETAGMGGHVHPAGTWKREVVMGYIAGQAHDNCNISNNLVDSKDMTKLSYQREVKVAYGIGDVDGGTIEKNYFLRNDLFNKHTYESDEIEIKRVSTKLDYEHSPNVSCACEINQFDHPFLFEHGINKITFNYRWNITNLNEPGQLLSIRMRYIDDIEHEYDPLEAETAGYETFIRLDYDRAVRGKDYGHYITITHQRIEGTPEVDKDGRDYIFSHKFIVKMTLEEYPHGVIDEASDTSVRYIDNLSEADLAPKGPGIIGEKNDNPWSYNNDRYEINTSTATTYDEAMAAYEKIKADE